MTTDAQAAGSGDHLAEDLPPGLADLPADGLVAVVKRDCPTCELVVPALHELAGGPGVTVVVQDDPTFPEGLHPVDDTALRITWQLDLLAVPTLLRFAGGHEVERVVGWQRSDWERVAQVDGLAADLPDWKPGCGSKHLDVDIADAVAARWGSSGLASRRVELADAEDEVQAGYDHGWADGLPVVMPTEARVLAMLTGTTRDPSEVVAVVPPDLVEVTVEKVAVNAVLAGCLPEHLPVVLAAVEAFCTETFNGHGLLATTYFSGPVVIVNGPLAARVGLESGGNVLGGHARANATIGRALNLVVRNIGGGRPGGVDRAALGNPGKAGWCFAEREHDTPFTTLAGSRGVPDGRSAVTLFAGAGVTPVVDQISREPESLARSIASVLVAVAHPKLALGFDALLVLSPEHGRVFAAAGWSRDRIIDELVTLTTRPGDELVRGAGGIAEGLPASVAGQQVPKFRPGGLMMVRAGGDAGLFSAVIGGWVSGAAGSEPVTVEIRE